MPAAITPKESDSSQCVAHTNTVLPPGKVSGDNDASAESFPHSVTARAELIAQAYSKGLSAVERSAKILKGKLIFEHRRAKKPSHVAETGGTHKEDLHNFPQHCAVSDQSEVILADHHQQSEQIQKIMVADRQELESCEKSGT
jgi:hypothetical protein